MHKTSYAEWGVRFLLILLAGALSAVAAAIAGSLLSLGGGYDEATLAWHKRLGILEEPKARHPTTFAVDDPAEATEILDNFLEGR